MTLDDWWQALRWQIAKDTGWMLDIIDDLNFEVVWSYLSVQDSDIKAAKLNGYQISRRS